MANITLRNAIEKYLREEYEHSGKAQTTIVNTRSKLKRFCSHANANHRHSSKYEFDIPVRKVVPGDISTFLSKYNNAGSYNNMLSVLKQFFDWCCDEHYVNRDQFTRLFKRRKQQRYIPEDRIRIPMSKFPLLLETAGKRHPRDRASVALALGTMGRVQSEIAPLKVNDVDFQNNRIKLIRTKIRDPRPDYIPMMSDLAEELRQWLAWYSEYMLGEGLPLYRHAYLVPAFQSTREYYVRENGLFVSIPMDQRVINPDRPQSVIGRPLKQVLIDSGVVAKDTSIKECTHTYRRSAARAFFERNRKKYGDIETIEILGTWLGHSDRKNTMRYIGYDPAQELRNQYAEEDFAFTLPSAENIVSIAQR